MTWPEFTILLSDNIIIYFMLLPEYMMKTFLLFFKKSITNLIQTVQIMPGINLDIWNRDISDALALTSIVQAMRLFVLLQSFKIVLFFSKHFEEFHRLCFVWQLFLTICGRQSLYSAFTNPFHKYNMIWNEFIIHYASKVRYCMQVWTVWSSWKLSGWIK